MSVVCAICLIVCAGALLRLYSLERRPFRQGEIYVPGIARPAGVSNQQPRLTLFDTVTGALKDSHPPTWYYGNVARLCNL